MLMMMTGYSSKAQKNLIKEGAKLRTREGGFMVS